MRFKIVRRDAGVYLLQFFTDAGTSLIGVYLTDQGKLGFRNDVAGQDAHSTTTVSSGHWHELQMHLQVAAQRHVQIWLDGISIKLLDQPATHGTTPIGRFQIGESATGDTFTVAFDDVVLATQFIPSSYPSAPSTPTVGTTTSPPTPTAVTTSSPPTPTTTTTSSAPPAAPTSGVPAAGCPTGQTACAGVCTNLSGDARNCGGCGVACAQGQICTSSTCIAAGCPAGQIACGADVSAKCVNLQTDPNNCGTCFTVCGQGQTCSGGVCTGGPTGACAGGCGQTQACCSGTCVNLGDEANCGACGNACGQGQVCCNSRSCQTGC